MTSKPLPFDKLLRPRFGNLQEPPDVQWKRSVARFLRLEKTIKSVRAILVFGFLVSAVVALVFPGSVYFLVASVVAAVCFVGILSIVFVNRELVDLRAHLKANGILP